MSVHIIACLNVGKKKMKRDLPWLLQALPVTQSANTIGSMQTNALYITIAIKSTS